jgi:hypothetical protein
LSLYFPLEKDSPRVEVEFFSGVNLEDGEDKKKLKAQF